MICARVYPLGAALALTLMAASAPRAAAQQAPEPNPADIRQAVTRGLDVVVSQQARDGSWGTRDPLAITSMCGLALLASGSTPEHGAYARSLSRAVSFVLSCQDESGQAFVHPASGYSAIHNHGYALLFLTQVYGESGPLDEPVRAAIQRGIQASVGSQFPNGGFGYFLYRRIPAEHTDMWRDDESSTTISQIQALRGARNAGFHVPFQALERAEAYIARCQHADSGGFVYSIGSTPPRISFVEGSDRPTFAITAACTAVLHALGTYEGPLIQRGLDYLEAFQPPTRRDLPFFYYGHYYAAQVFHQVGGERARRWRDAVALDLLARQRPLGDWPDSPFDGLPDASSSLLNSAYALQVLQLPRSLLPIHQR